VAVGGVEEDEHGVEATARGFRGEGREFHNNIYYFCNDSATN
jgi:hypothetical protein